MGLVSDDPYGAYCLDEATYLWGAHVEAEVHRATRKAKTDDEAQRKAETALRGLLSGPGRPESTDPTPTPSEAPQGRFRDPATIFGR